MTHQPAQTLSPLQVTGVILAGGRARRMDGVDKAIIPVCGKPLVEHAISALRPQVNHLIISANRGIEHYARYGYPVVKDVDPDFCGPLAGMLSAMEVAATEYVAVVPCDSPRLPRDLVRRLIASLNQTRADLCAAHDGERMQQLFLLVRRDLAPCVRRYLKEGGRRVASWLQGQNLAMADFSDCPEAFLNINTPEDREALERRLKDTGLC